MRAKIALYIALQDDIAEGLKSIIMPSYFTHYLTKRSRAGHSQRLSQTDGPLSLAPALIPAGNRPATALTRYGDVGEEGEVGDGERLCVEVDASWNEHGELSALEVQGVPHIDSFIHSTLGKHVHL